MTIKATPKELILATRASAMFDAIMDYVLANDAPRTNPRITAMTITSDGFLMAWNTARPDKEGFIGSAGDFDRNLRGICQHVGLSAEDTEDIVTEAYTRVTDWRPSRDR